MWLQVEEGDHWFLEASQQNSCLASPLKLQNQSAENHKYNDCLFLYMQQLYKGTNHTSPPPPKLSWNWLPAVH